MTTPRHRPKTEINWEQVGKLLEADCKTVDIAAQFGISSDTLTRRCKQELGLTFTAFSQQKRASGDNLLRAAQFKAAVADGNTTMQIWLGKQRLGQAEKTEVTGKGGAPIVAARQPDSTDPQFVASVLGILAAANALSGGSGESNEPAASSDAE